MATTITTTDELQIELKDSTGQYNRILRVTSPVSNVSRAQVETALAPAINAREGETSDTAVVPFFFDDANTNAGLTVIGDITHVVTRREETPI